MRRPFGTRPRSGNRVFGPGRRTASSTPADGARGGVLSDALQHVDQIGVRVRALQLAGREQTLDHADALGTQLGGCKLQPGSRRAQCPPCSAVSPPLRLGQPRRPHGALPGNAHMPRPALGGWRPPQQPAAFEATYLFFVRCLQCGIQVAKQTRFPTGPRWKRLQVEVRIV